jgi:hypothetical protein
MEIDANGVVSETEYNKWIEDLNKLSRVRSDSAALNKIIANIVKQIKIKVQSRKTISRKTISRKTITGGVKIKSTNRYSTSTRRPLSFANTATRRQEVYREYRPFHRNRVNKVQSFLVGAAVILQFILFTLSMKVAGVFFLPTTFMIFCLFNSDHSKLQRCLEYIINLPLPAIVTGAVVNSWHYVKNFQNIKNSNEIVKGIERLSAADFQFDTSSQNSSLDAALLVSPLVTRPLPTGVKSAEIMLSSMNFSHVLKIGDLPTYQQLIGSTQDYLLRKGLQYSDANRRRVMLLSMAAMTGRVVSLLVNGYPEGSASRRSRDSAQRLISRITRGRTVRKAITVDQPDITKCDRCERYDDDEYDPTTFSSASCVKCRYDTCDRCISEVKECPGCKFLRARNSGM